MREKPKKKKLKLNPKIVLPVYGVILVAVIIFLVIAFKPSNPELFSNVCMIEDFLCSNFTLRTSGLSFDLENAQQDISYIRLELIDQEPQGCVLEPFKMPWHRGEKRTFSFDCGKNAVGKKPLWLVFDLTYTVGGLNKTSRGSISSDPVR